MLALRFYEAIGVNSAVAIEILSISAMMLAGFLMTRLTKRLGLPNVTAYIVAGILIGPFCLDLIPPNIVSGTSFLPDIALAFIAFGTGEYFRFSVLKKNGLRVVWITLTEALLATVLVFGLCFGILRLSLPFSIVLSALAAATAPASTLMTIRQLRARGEFVDTLLQVVALDNIVALLAYSISISIATATMTTGHVGIASTLLPILSNAVSVVLGGAIGAITALFMKRRHSSDNRLIITVTMLFFFCGICALLETSPLLGCMAMGTVYINLTDDERLFRQVAYFNPPILMLFFVRSGVSFDFHSLFARSASIGSHSLLVIGVGYFVARIVGKYGGAMLGSRFVGANNSIRRYLGLALIPQAGVAIGLSELGARTLGGEPGVALQTIILASSILYELIGPPSAKGALLLSGSCETDGDATDGDTTEGIAEGEPAVEDASGARTSAVKPKTEDSGGYDLPDEKADEHVFSEEADRFYEDSADSGHHKKHKKHKKDKEKDKEKDKKKHKNEK